MNQRLRESAEELERSLEDLRNADGARRTLLASLVQAQESERQRIASDIHDDSIQKIAAVGLRLEVLKRQLSDPKQLETVARLEESVDLSISRLRHLVFELWPPSLDRHGLTVAVRLHLEETQAQTGLLCNLDARVSSEPPLETAILAYRILQEAVSNARKHAQASRIDVQIEADATRIHARVRDDGAGLAPETLERSAPGHLGIPAMRERAEMAGGWVRLQEAQGGGTVVEFELPLLLPDTEGSTG